MYNYTFLDLAKEVLEYFGGTMTVDEIWEGAEKLKLLDKLGSNGLTPKSTLSARIYVDIQKKGDNSIFYKEGKRPVKFGLKGNKDNADSEKILKKLNKGKSKKFNERDLHILLSTFVKNNENFKCVTKTIMHEKSKKEEKGKNEWLHPDIVGVYYPFYDYSENVLKLFKISETPYKLFSFELKKELNYRNLREYYFQAVSNSSWSNEGYLVALKIDDSIYDELRRLNNSFGIGIIKLNPKNIFQSEILFSAREHKNLDWDTIDRLAVENEDFISFIEDLYLDTQANKIRGKYDKTFDTEEETETYSIEKGIL